MSDRTDDNSVDAGRVRTIPPQLAFLDALAAGLAATVASDPLDRASVRIILPTRRACRALAESFLRESGGAPLLLPTLTALGDLDGDELELAGPAGLDLPVAMPPLRRQLLLARLVEGWGAVRGGEPILPGQALALARDLGALLDEAEREGVSLDRLDAIVPEDLAVHWGQTTKFLDIIRVAWPRMLAAHGMIDAEARQQRLIEAQIDLWQSETPATPVIAAGFAQATPAIARLLAALARLPHGLVILPGLDRAADDEVWQAVIGDPMHPQHGMAHLLDRLGVARASVGVWPPSFAGIAEAPRQPLIRELTRPSDVTDRWRTLSPFAPAALDGITRLDLPGAQEEAIAIAMLLRAQLEHRQRTAMLVTPDRGLARRVAAALGRWHVEIDDSAGRPLGQTPPGLFLRLIAEAALEGLAPVPLLALLKHPLAAGGLAAPAFRGLVRSLDRDVLRGPRPAPGFAGLRRATSGRPELADLVERVAAALEPFTRLVADMPVPLGTLAAAHVAAAEALAATDTEPGPERLWAMEAGEALARFFAELIDAADAAEPSVGRHYPVQLEAMLGDRVARPRFGLHPRLRILGVLEARLQSADLVILGGLNEGVWPAQAEHDPFLSRPMRAALGLPPLEAEIGIAAHDFAIGLGAPEVVLTRAARIDGAETVPSRWLQRLDTVLIASGQVGLPRTGRDAEQVAAWAAAYETPSAIPTLLPPEPRPPVGLRPRRLSVTAIERWMRDPYAIYAEHILKLRALDPLDGDPGAAERGQIIHQALAQFVNAWPPPGALPEGALERLIEIGHLAFGPALERPGVWAFWWPRFVKIARWFIDTEAARRPALATSAVERTGTLALDRPGGIFLLRAQADRIDVDHDGRIVIIDYKTGTPPSNREVENGLAPQLPLEAVIAAAGGFAGVAGGDIEGLEFWGVSGGHPPGKITAIKDPSARARQARDGLERLIDSFDRETTPYRALPRPDAAPRYSDYGHLARVLEWGSVAE